MLEQSKPLLGGDVRLPLPINSLIKNKHVVSPQAIDKVMSELFLALDEMIEPLETVRMFQTCVDTMSSVPWFHVWGDLYQSCTEASFDLNAVCEGSYVVDEDILRNVLISYQEKIRSLLWKKMSYVTRFYVCYNI